MEHLVKAELSDEYVKEQLAPLEPQFASVDVLAPIADEAIAAPEVLTDEEVDLRFNEAVRLIEEDTTPEEGERFRELRMQCHTLGGWHVMRRLILQRSLQPYYGVKPAGIWELVLAH